jgi:hypothetical protein
MSVIARRKAQPQRGEAFRRSNPKIKAEKNCKSWIASSETSFSPRNDSQIRIAFAIY